MTIWDEHELESNLSQDIEYFLLFYLTLFLVLFYK